MTLAESIERNCELMRWAAETIRELKSENALLKARLKLCDIQFARMSQPVEDSELPAMVRKQCGPVQ